MATFQLDIVSAERHVSSDQVEVLVAPGIDGEMAILPSHAPLLTILKPGEIRVVKDGQDSFIAVSGGFMEVMGNRTVILADSAERAEEIDEARAQAAFDKAEERMTSRDTDVDFERAVQQLARARTRLQVARRRRPMAPTPPTG
ncbi:MAG: F0F1 ATP synthase subunit epsilon [Chloroflexi bacterium]|nr:F0F1 ATP synthase subunit epsilon [Chloroflexota bacterium]